MSDQQAEDLLTAASAYVEARGGKMVVAGPIEVIKMPDDLLYNFRLAIRFTGNPPMPYVETSNP